MGILKKKKLVKLEQFTLPDFLKDQWKELDVELLEQWYIDAEKFLIEGLKTFESCTNRAYRLLSIAILAISLSSGYLFNNIKNFNPDDVMLYTACIVIIICIFCINRLALTIWSHGIKYNGTIPDKAMNISIYENIEKEFYYKKYLLNSCVNFKKRIDHNDTVNSKRIKYSNQALIALICIPSSPIIGLILIIFFGR